MKTGTEFVPDRTAKYKTGELDLPSIGSEFPGMPIEANEKPEKFFGKEKMGRLPDANDLANKHA